MACFCGVQEYGRQSDAGKSRGDLTADDAGLTDSSNDQMLPLAHDAVQQFNNIRERTIQTVGHFLKGPALNG